MDHQTLVSQASLAGFAQGDINNIITQYGPEILQLLVQLAQQGFSVTWLVSAVTTLAPVILTLIQDLNNQPTPTTPPAPIPAPDGPPGPIIQGEQVDSFTMPNGQDLINIFTDLAPIIQALLALLAKYKKK